MAWGEEMNIPYGARDRNPHRDVHPGFDADAPCCGPQRGDGADLAGKAAENVSSRARLCGDPDAGMRRCGKIQRWLLFQ